MPVRKVSFLAHRDTNSAVKHRQDAFGSGTFVDCPVNFERHPLVPESPWLEAPTLTGRYVVLEALRPEHAAELFHALDDEEVWRYIPSAQPRNPDEMAAGVAASLRAWALGQRVPWVYRAASTGEVVGMSSYA